MGWWYCDAHRSAGHFEVERRERAASFSRHDAEGREFLGRAGLVDGSSGTGVAVAIPCQFQSGKR